MAKFLADENMPAHAIEAARNAGHDLAWIKEISPGADDEDVLGISLANGRVLLTFDRDFGEMVFREGRRSSRGVILLRPRLSSPETVTQFVLTVLAQSIDWEGHFAVAQEGKLRVVPLPD